jgi:hypothetical protein
MRMALARAKRRRREGGAVLFIVAMTLAVLGSLGIYALQSTAYEVRASGNERQEMQTHYIAEYGAVAATSQINTGTAGFYIGVIMNSTDYTATQPCYSLRGVPLVGSAPAAVACRRMGRDELGQNWLPPANNDNFSHSSTAFRYSNPPIVTEGSLGYSGVDPDFWVELTDPMQKQPPAGYDLKQNLCFHQYTLTSYGMTKPNTNTSSASSVWGGEGLEGSRARITAGPVQYGCGK